MFSKLELILVIYLGLGLTVLQAQTMNVREIGGAQTTYPLNNIRKISFTSDSIVVCKNTGIPCSHAFSSLRYLNFTDSNSKVQNIEIPKGSLQLFPNPVRFDLININLSMAGSQECLIEIVSLDGKVIYKEKINKPDKIFQMNVSALTKGLYICKVINGTTTKTTKFIKL